MFGWLNSILGWASSGLDDLWKKVISVFQVIYSYVDGWINQLIKDINSVYQWTWSLIQSVERLAQSIYTIVVNWVINNLVSLEAWVGRLWNSLYSYAQGIAAWTSGWISRIYSDVTGWISGLENWVLRDIWDPLYNFISGALRWIAREGAWVFYLLTHPDQLALLLGRYILGAWMNLGRRYAGPMGRWMIHTLMSLSGDLAGILEDFIAGIL
jgi:hypothetical protein